MRYRIQLTLFRSSALLLLLLFSCRLFSHWPEVLCRCRLHRILLIVSLRAPSSSIRLRCNELLVTLSRLAWLGGLGTLVLLLGRARLFAGGWADHGRLSLGWSLHQAGERVVLTHAFSCVAHQLLIGLRAFLAPCGRVLRDLAIGHHCFRYFSLAGLLLLHIYLVHLVLLHSLFLVHLLNLLIAHHHLLPI